VLGDVGDQRHLEFAVVGDTVNVASRLQELTRTLGAPLIASDAVVAAARAEPDGARDAPRVVPLPPQALRGRVEPIAVWATRVA
jgi:adenylate cyclase